MTQYADADMLLDACFDEFCDAIGGEPVGCEVCPYQETKVGECRNAYKRDKLEKLEVEE